MNTNLPAILEGKLADFRRRVWVVKLAEGLLAALFGIALSYLLVFALDRFFETPGWVRLCLLVAGAATLGLGLPLKWHRWVWRQRRLEDAAPFFSGNNMANLHALSLHPNKTRLAVVGTNANSNGNGRQLKPALGLKVVPTSL